MEEPFWGQAFVIVLLHLKSLHDRCDLIPKDGILCQAIANDPLTAAVLSLAEIKQMVNQMFAKNRTYLPQFKHFIV